MELIRISDKKLKIMLTPSDMEQFELNADTFGEDGVEMRRSFRLLLEEIKKRTDFETDDKRISVQYFPSREGGCEMFISRLSDGLENMEKEQTDLHTPRALCLHREPSGRSFHRETAYCFRSISDLLHVCRRLCAISCIGTNSAYSDKNGFYYLFLSFLSASPFTTPDELIFITEYGSIENSGMLRLYLSEHGTAICHENAVHQLGVLI